MTVLEGIERTALPTRRTRVASYNFVPRNYLHDPARLDLSTWTKTRSYALYDPVADECRLVEDGTATNNHVVYQSPTMAAGAHTIGWLVKAAGRTWVATTMGAAVAYFNLATGAVGTNSGFDAVPVPVDYGNGWWLIPSVDTLSAGSVSFNLYIAEADNDASYSGTGHQGTAAAGGTLNTLVMAAGASAVDDVYVGTECLNFPDAPGVWHTVTGYVGSTKVLTFTPARTTVPDGLTYTVGPGIAIKHASLVPGEVAKPFSDEGNHQVIALEDDDGRNDLFNSEALDAAGGWAKLTGGTASTAVITDDYLVAGQSRVQLALNGGTSAADQSGISQNSTTNCLRVLRTEAKTTDGSTKVVQLRVGNAVLNATISGDFQPLTCESSDAAATVYIWLRGGQGTSDSVDIILRKTQLHPGTRRRPYVKTTSVAYNKDVTAGASAAADAADPTLDKGRKVAGSHYMKTASLPALKGFDLAFYVPTAVSAGSAAAHLVGLPWTAVTTAGLAVGAATASQTDEILTIMEASGAQSAAWCHATDTIAIGWHIVQIDWDGSAWRLWLDGAEKTLTVAGTPVGFSLDGVVYLGSTTAPGSFLTGTYGHFAPHSASRSAVEVDRDYRAMKIDMSRVGVEF